MNERQFFPACPLFRNNGNEFGILSHFSHRFFLWVCVRVAFLFVMYFVQTLINLNSIHDVLIFSFSSWFFFGSSQHLKTLSIQSYRDECHILFLFLSKVLIISGGNWRTIANYGKTSKPCNSLPRLHICSTQTTTVAKWVKDSLMLIWDTYTKLW